MYFQLPFGIVLHYSYDNCTTKVIVGKQWESSNYEDILFLYLKSKKNKRIQQLLHNLRNLKCIVFQHLISQVFY